MIAAPTAHINVHEAGAIEATGHKVLVLPERSDGKVWAQDVDEYIECFYNDETYDHMVAPGMVYISHPTELGAIYTLNELEALSIVCHKHKIPLYMDGARLGYGLAAVGADVTLKDVARLCDVFYIGGTKVGALFGEAVVVTNKERLPHFFTLIKQHGALLAKGRLTAIQFETLFTDDLYLRISHNAVSMAMRLKQMMLSMGFKLYADSPTNQQFFVLPNNVMDYLAQYVTFEVWGNKGKEETAVRFVTDWGTKSSELDELNRILKQPQSSSN